MKMASMTFFALNSRRDNQKKTDNGSGGKTWAYEAAQLTCSLKTRHDMLSLIEVKIRNQNRKIEIT